MTLPRALGDRIDLRRTGASPDYWYPLAWSDEIARGKALASRFAGLPIVLYRGRSGAIHALEDACAHRQVPLSQGLVEGETLRCGYHGWRYDGAGACVDVPYLGQGGCQGRVSNGVTAYPVREVDGMVSSFPAIPRWPRRAHPARWDPKPTVPTRPGGWIAASPATTPSCTRICST